MLLFDFTSLLPDYFLLTRTPNLSSLLGIDYRVHAQCTTMEGEMGAIMYALKACHEALHAMGCPRIESKYVLSNHSFIIYQKD